MNWWMEKWNHFEKKHLKPSKMDISDCIFFCIQHGSDHSPVFVFYIYAGYSWRKTGRNRIYVATGADEDCRSGIYMELIGV